MLKKVLWLALACAVLLAALALSRQLGGPSAKVEPKGPAEKEDVAKPAAAAPKALEVVPEPTPLDLQMEEDAAATGMTTVEPEPAPPQPDQAAEPPTN